MPRKGEPPVSKPSRTRSAFTLLELVIVLGVVLALTATLASTFSQATNQLRELTCTNNLRQAGGAFIGFAQMHEGRFPNRAWWDTNKGAADPGHWNPQSGFSPWWQSILNWEYFHQNDPANYPGPRHTLGDEPTCGPLLRWWTFWDPMYYPNQNLVVRKYLTCPNYKAWGSPGAGYSNIWSRPWMANRDVTGGDTSAYGYELTGIYGKNVSNPASIFYYYGAYALGTRQDLFANPSYKFLLIESEYGADVTTVRSGYSATVRLGDSVARPPWTGDGGVYAFRHNLGTDARLYQSRARAPFLFVDGHVGVLTPNDQINVSSRFVPTP